MKELRVGPDTFKYIVNLFQIQIQKESTTFRKAVSVEKRVAIAM